MKVSSKKSVYFPKLNWGINAGETRDLPDGIEAQSIILAHNAISKVTDVPKKSSSSESKKD